MPVKKTPEDPKLPDLNSLLKKDIFLSMNCHGVARIESFDTSNQTASATMFYKKTYYEENKNGEYEKVLVDYPILLDCPCVVMGGGDFSLKMPIKKGDECLVLFNDRSIDRWFESGQVVDLESSRLHSFSDGILLVGLRSAKKPLSGYEDDKVVLGDGIHDLKLGDGIASLSVSATIMKLAEKVTVENAAENLNTLLQNLLTEIQAITVSGVTPGGGASGPPINAVALAAIATRIGDLLE